MLRPAEKKISRIFGGGCYRYSGEFLRIKRADGSDYRLLQNVQWYRSQINLAHHLQIEGNLFSWVGWKSGQVSSDREDLDNASVKGVAASWRGPSELKFHLYWTVFRNERWSIAVFTMVLATICADTITTGTRRGRA
jgi:hypothetical protein